MKTGDGLTALVVEGTERLDAEVRGWMEEWVSECLDRCVNACVCAHPGARGGAVGTSRKVAGLIPDGVIGIFH